MKARETLILLRVSLLVSHKVKNDSAENEEKPDIELTFSFDLKVREMQSFHCSEYKPFELSGAGDGI